MIFIKKLGKSYIYCTMKNKELIEFNAFLLCNTALSIIICKAHYYLT